MTTQPLRLPSYPDTRRLKNELPDPAWRYDVGGTFHPHFPACHFVLIAKQPDTRCHEVTELQLPLAEPHPIGISGAVRQNPSNFVINYPVARILHQFGCHLVRFLFVFARPARPVIFDCRVLAIVTWEIQISNRENAHVAAARRGCRVDASPDFAPADRCFSSVIRKSIH